MCITDIPPSFSVAFVSSGSIITVAAYNHSTAVFEVFSSAAGKFEIESDSDWSALLVDGEYAMVADKSSGDLYVKSVRESPIAEEPYIAFMRKDGTIRKQIAKLSKTGVFSCPSISESAPPVTDDCFKFGDKISIAPGRTWVNSITERTTLSLPLE